MGGQRSGTTGPHLAERHMPGAHVSAPGMNALTAKFATSRGVRCTFAALMVVALLSLAFAWQKWAVKEVVVHADGKSVRVTSLRSTVNGVLLDAGIPLRPEDRANFPLVAKVRNGMHIRVVRAFPVEIRLGKQRIQRYTIPGPIMQVLADAEINVGADDLVYPGRNAVVQSPMALRVVRVKRETVVEQVKIPFLVERKPMAQWEKGRTTLVREGRAGLAEHRIQLTIHDGQVVMRTLLSKKVVQAPVDKVVGIGIKPVVRTVLTSRGPRRYTSVKRMLATAYDPGADSTYPWNDGITATGVKAQKGVVAVDPRVIPLGTRVYVPGYGEALAADVGGAIKGNRIDLCYNTRREAIQFGRRYVTVYILQ